MPVTNDYEGYNPVLTAHELAQLLLSGPNVRVALEGCDCVGDCGGVDVEDGRIVLTRPEPLEED